MSRNFNAMSLNEFVASVQQDHIDVNAHIDTETGDISLVVCGKGDGAELLYNVLSRVIDMPNPLPEPGVQA